MFQQHAKMKKMLLQKRWEVADDISFFSNNLQLTTLFLSILLQVAAPFQASTGFFGGVPAGIHSRKLTAGT